MAPPQGPQYIQRVTPAQIIVLATPVFLAAIAIEFAVGVARGRNTYRLHDALSSIGLGMLSQLVALFTKLLAIGAGPPPLKSSAWALA